jgi:Pup-ligase protein.
VGIGTESRTQGFQLSQRADFFEVEVGLETTLKRPIINTRDEPHADADKYRRLHVIIGDANLAELSTYLKVGTTALVLDMIEARTLTRDLSLEEPVAELQAISHDPSLTHRVRLRDGRRMTALEVQQSYLEMAQRHVDRHGEDDGQSADVLRRWAEVLEDLAVDPMRCADRLDWPAKLRLLEGYRSRDGLAWGDSRLHLVDLQYSDVRPEKGLYHRLVSRGSMQRMLTDDEVTHAMVHPPSDTRAFFRGECLRRYPAQVAAASWDSVVFDLGRENLVRIPPWSRCGAPATTSARCSSRRPRRRSWSTPSPAADPGRSTSVRRTPRVTSAPGTSHHLRTWRNPWPRGTAAVSSARRAAGRRPRRSRRRSTPRSPSATRRSPRTSTPSSTKSTRYWRKILRNSLGHMYKKGASDHFCLAAAVR